MILDAETYRKALRVVGGYESKLKDGTATDAERRRLTEVLDHVLAWEWAHGTAAAVEVIPRAPEDRPAPVLPGVLEFCDWWGRVKYSPMWRAQSWHAGLVHWWSPRGWAGYTHETTWAVEDELARRGDAEVQYAA
jgi:hypothetical protein